MGPPQERAVGREAEPDSWTGSPPCRDYHHQRTILRKDRPSFARPLVRVGRRGASSDVSQPNPDPPNSRFTLIHIAPLGSRTLHWRMRMLLLLAGCAAPDNHSGSHPGGTSDTGDTSELRDWEVVNLAPDPFIAVEDRWAVGARGRVVGVGEPWTDLGGSVPKDVRAVTTKSGELWSLSADSLAHWDGAWSSVPFEDQTGGTDLVALADGTIAVLYSHMDCDDCEGAIYSNDLAIWDGYSWVITRPPLTEAGLRSLAVLDDGTLVAGGGTSVATWTGKAWSDENVGAYLQQISASGAEVMAVGQLLDTGEGAVVHGVPGALVVDTVGTVPLLGGVIGIDGTLWAFGDEKLWTNAGSGWTSSDLPPGDWVDITTSASGVILVGNDHGPVGIEGVNGTFSESWRESAIPTGALWVDDQGNAWTSEYGTVGRWADERVAWSVDGENRALSGSSSSDIVAVGWESIAEWDGTTWTPNATTEYRNWSDVSAASDGSVWVVGTSNGDEENNQALALHRAAGEWSVEVALPTSDASSVFVMTFSEHEAYIVASGGSTSLLRWDGAAWSTVATELCSDPADLWGRSGTDLYLGCGAGLFHWDGSTLTAVEGGPTTISAIGGDATALLVSGWTGHGETESAVVAEYTADGWTELVRSEFAMPVGVGGGVQVVIVGPDGWRRATTE